LNFILIYKHCRNPYQSILNKLGKNITGIVSQSEKPTFDDIDWQEMDNFGGNWDDEISVNSFSGKAITQIESEFGNSPNYINLRITVDGKDYEISFNKSKYRKKFLAIDRTLGETATHITMDYSDAPWFKDINWR
jgi:hypothetical protein